MSTRVQEGMLPVGIEVEGHGIAFNVEYNGDAVEVEVEYPDYSGWSGPRTDTRYITIAREDWDAIVAHVASGRATRHKERKDDPPFDLRHM